MNSTPPLIPATKFFNLFSTKKKYHKNISLIKSKLGKGEESGYWLQEWLRDELSC